MKVFRRHKPFVMKYQPEPPPDCPTKCDMNDVSGVELTLFSLYGDGRRGIKVVMFCKSSTLL